uniref:Uncharacterized protein n=1 Tax=Salix viminalis TaxID=40686 RepID=A0A6N2NGR1_SALVM
MVVEVFPLWWIGYWIIRSWLLPIVLFSAIFVWFLAIIFLLWVHGYAIVQMRLVYWFGGYGRAARFNGEGYKASQTLETVWM